MSRGHGKVQRRILEALAEHAAQHPPLEDFEGEMRFTSWMTVAELAPDESRSAKEATRRAVLRLADEGLVETFLVGRGGYGTRRLHLSARAMPDEDTRTAWGQAWERYQGLRSQALASLLATANT